MESADTEKVAEDEPQESSRQESTPPSVPPTQSPIGTPLTARPRLEPSKPPSAVSKPISPTPVEVLTEPFRQSSKSPELLSQKLKDTGDDSGLMHPMNSSMHTMDIPDQLKEILAPTPPTKSPSFPTKPQYEEQSQAMNTLMIDNLPSRLTQDGFLDLFVQFGDIKSARLVTNPDGSTRGYGYVNFATHEDALQAIKHYDGFILWGQALKAGFAKRTPSRNQPEGSLLTITEFPRTWGKAELHAVFQEFGEILEVSILESHGIGLVRFLRSLDARVALSSRNGWIVPENGRPLQVRLGKEASTPEPNPNAFPTSVISPNSETYEMPINLFGGLYSPPRRFAEQNPAENRHKPKNQYQMKMQDRAKPAPTTSSTAPCSEMVFLYNLPTFFKKAHVDNFCSLYGKIKSVSMQKDNTGCYLGMAYVMYSTQEEAKSAVQALNGCSMFKQTISATLTKGG